MAERYRKYTSKHLNNFDILYVVMFHVMIYYMLLCSMIYYILLRSMSERTENNTGSVSMKKPH